MPVLKIRKILNSHNVDNNIINGRIIAYIPYTKNGIPGVDRVDVTDYSLKKLYILLGY